jgi:hypothetical protein
MVCISQSACPKDVTNKEKSVRRHVFANAMAIVPFNLVTAKAAEAVVPNKDWHGHRLAWSQIDVVRNRHGQRQTYSKTGITPYIDVVSAHLNNQPPPAFRVRLEFMCVKVHHEVVQVPAESRQHTVSH